jgi:pilus assembly protein CpaF
MTFFSNVTPRTRAQPVVEVITREPAPVAKEHIYSELIAQRPALLDEKLKLHARIIDEFNLVSLEKLPREDLVREVRAYLGEYVRTERLSLNQKELQAFAEEVVDEMTGFGPIEPLLKDPTVNDILINTHKKCFVERFGKLEATSVHFKDEAHLMLDAGLTNPPQPSTLDCLTGHASMSRSDRSRLMARWFRSGSSQKTRFRWIALSSSTRFDLQWQIC